MNTTIKILIILTICSGLFIQCGSGNHDSSENSRPDSIVYKQTPQGELKLYFHYPDDWKPSDKRPLIVFFFGGGWKSGRISQFSYQSEYLAGRGMVAVLADYRVLERHGTMPDKCVEDGKSAVRWLRKNASILGADPDKIVSSGGSAGGHVAICTKLIEGLDSKKEDLAISSEPNLLVLYNPVLKTTHERLVNRMGSEEMALRISPDDHFDESAPPMIMFFGSDDLLIGYAFETIELASELDLDANLWIAESKGHGFFNKSPWLESTTYLTDKFLTGQGYLKGEPTIAIPEDGIMKLYKQP